MREQKFGKRENSVIPDNENLENLDIPDNQNLVRQYMYGRTGIDRDIVFVS